MRWGELNDKNLQRHPAVYDLLAVQSRFASIDARIDAQDKRLQGLEDRLFNILLASLGGAATSLISVILLLIERRP